MTPTERTSGGQRLRRGDGAGVCPECVRVVERTCPRHPTAELLDAGDPDVLHWVATTRDDEHRRRIQWAVLAAAGSGLATMPLCLWVYSYVPLKIVLLPALLPGALLIWAFRRPSDD